MIRNADSNAPVTGEGYPKGIRRVSVALRAPPAADLREQFARSIFGLGACLSDYDLGSEILKNCFVGESDSFPCPAFRTVTGLLCFAGAKRIAFTPSVLHPSWRSGSLTPYRGYGLLLFPHSRLFPGRGCRFTLPADGRTDSTQALLASSANDKARSELLPHSEGSERAFQICVRGSNAVSNAPISRDRSEAVKLFFQGITD